MARCTTLSLVTVDFRSLALIVALAVALTLVSVPPPARPAAILPELVRPKHGPDEVLTRRGGKKR